MRVLTSVAAGLSTVLLAGIPVGFTALTGTTDSGSETPENSASVTSNRDRPADDSDHRAAGDRDDRAAGDRGDRARKRDEGSSTGKETGPPAWARSRSRLGREHGRLVRTWAHCLGRHSGAHSACGARPTPPGLAKGMPPGLGKPGHQRPDGNRRHEDGPGRD